MGGMELAEMFCIFSVLLLLLLLLSLLLCICLFVCLFCFVLFCLVGFFVIQKWHSHFTYDQNSY